MNWPAILYKATLIEEVCVKQHESIRSTKRLAGVSWYECMYFLEHDLIEGEGERLLTLEIADRHLLIMIYAKGSAIDQRVGPAVNAFSGVRIDNGTRAISNE